MAKETKKKVVTRKEMTRLHREQRQRSYIIGGTIVVLAVVIGLVVFGLSYELVFKGMKTVANVNGERISLKDFQEEVQFQRYQQIQTYSSYAQLYNAFGAQMGSSFLGNLQSIENSLSEENKVTFGQDVLQNMVDNVAIAQYAEENGITVSQEEIDKAIEEQFGYYANGTPTPTLTATPFVTSTLSAEQYALVSPTPTNTEIPPTEEVTPTATQAQQTPDATVESTAAEATEPAATEAVVDEGTATATLEPTATATEYTYQGFEGERDAVIEGMADINFTRADLDILFRYSVLREKVYEQITADVKSEQEQVWARHILVADEATAKEVLQKLNDGADWAALAEEYSTDESNKYAGGDLGWFSHGQMVASFEEAAFSLKIGEISEPVQSDYGYHIIQVLGHEVRPLTQSALQTSKDQVFSKWLDELTAKDSVKILDNWVNDVPLTPVIPPEMIVATPQP